MLFFYFALASYYTDSLQEGMKKITIFLKLRTQLNDRVERRSIDKRSWVLRLEGFEKSNARAWQRPCGGREHRKEV